MTPLKRVAALCIALAAALVAPVEAQAQTRIRMVECRTQDCWGGPSREDSMTPVVMMLQGKVAQLDRILPPDIRIEVMIVGGTDFNHRYVRGRPHLITIGVNALADLHNSWVQTFYTGGQNVEQAFGAIVEWAFYHEVGHALLEHAAEREPVLRNNDAEHERLADRFATVALMFSNADAVTRVRYASQGIHALRLAQANEAAGQPEGVRGLTPSVAGAQPTRVKRRGVNGILGAHMPSPQRAWNIRCYLFGSGLGPKPEDFQGMHQGRPASFGCQEHDFNNALWELKQYAPFLANVGKDRVTHYDPRARQLRLVR